MKEKREEHICMICEQSKQKGIYIYKAFICKECERKVLQTAPEEEAYVHFVRKMRKIRIPSVFS
ncbi:sigma factor G inhibitor Gin [Bacillus sp. REN10]|uniref:sigma factor G inhibitor Gin n=1 Tax=Bacillus sp. REN10 TaxID=2782541 RepID=UPI00193B004D|nr:sigma factor G inhibitor Gin [Bacillus sp. REN10]